MLTILTPPNSDALTTPAAVIARYSDMASANTTVLGAMIEEQSGRIAAYCQRVFGLRQLEQTERPPYVAYSTYDPLVPGVIYREPPPIVLDDMGPILSIDALTAQGTTLVQNTDFELDGLRIFRLSNDMRVYWAFRKIVIDFTTGYVLPLDTGTTTLPAAIQSVCIDLVRLAWTALQRDPNVAKENIYGVAQVDYAIPGSNNAQGLKGGLPLDLAQRLDPFVYRAVI